MSKALEQRIRHKVALGLLPKSKLADLERAKAKEVL